MTETKPGGTGMREALEELRAAGWVVAVHNDYRANGMPCTFWLFTHPNGRYVKGEGLTDEEAITECARASLSSTGDERREAIEAALKPFARIAEWYDDREDDSFPIWKDMDIAPIRALTLGMCRAIRSLLHADGGEKP